MPSESTVPIFDTDGNPVENPDLDKGFLSCNHIQDGEELILESYTYRIYTARDLKQKLLDTDYVITKMSEYNVSGTAMPEADAERYAGIIEQREQWRKQINELEVENDA